MRQVAHEPDGVGEGVGPPVSRLGATHRRIERREQLVLHEHARVGEAVEDRALAGVRVPRDGDARHVVVTSAAALGVARRLHLGDLTAQLRHARVDATTVEFDLRLTRTARTHALTARGLTAGLTRHRLTPTAKTRQQVLHLGELDLGLALLALRVLGEDVEDERGAVDDLDLDDVLERASLAGRQLAVGDDGVGTLGDDDLLQFLGLALAEPGAGVGSQPALHDAGEHLGTGRLGERGELAQRVLRVLGVALAPDAGEDDLLQAQLAILDLGDVLQLGRQTVDTSKRRAFFALELVAVIGVDDEATLVVGGGRVVTVGESLGSAGQEVGGVALVQGWILTSKVVVRCGAVHCLASESRTSIVAGENVRGHRFSPVVHGGSGRSSGLIASGGCLVAASGCPTDTP